MTSNTIPFSGQVAAGRRVMVAGDTGKTTTAHWLRAALRTLSPAVEECRGDELHSATPGVGTTQADVVVVAQGFESTHKSTDVRHHAALERLVRHLAPGGRLVLNGDEPVLQRFAAGWRGNQVLQVGRGSHCDVIANEVQFHDGWLTLSVDGQSLAVPAWGRHHLHSVLAAYATGRSLDLSHADVVASLRHFRPAVGACQVVRTPTLTLVADRPDGRVTAMSAALDVLRELPIRGRRIVLCGWSRVEGRGDRAAWAQYGDRAVSRCGVDLVIGVGDAGTTTVAAARQAGLSAARAIACESADEAMGWLRPWLRSGDAILITARDEQELNEWIQTLAPLTDAVAA